MFGINGGELIILLVVVALVVGPERLPGYAEQLAKWVRSLRGYVQDARRRVDDELGDAGLDWEALDPRRYDPRRIVREALLDDLPADGQTVTPRPQAAAGPAGTPVPVQGGPAVAHQISSQAPAPYDDEAT
ncbi:MAG TPA: Sec-independent protein translocase TatB [Cellulomonas sp.]